MVQTGPRQLTSTVFSQSSFLLISAGVCADSVGPRGRFGIVELKLGVSIIAKASRYRSAFTDENKVQVFGNTTSYMTEKFAGVHYEHDGKIRCACYTTAE